MVAAVAWRWAKLAALGLCLTAALSAYYPFLHYPSRIGPFIPMPEKFDLAALPDKTVSVYVSDAGPARLTVGDSFTSVVSQIRMAVKAWDDVETSDLRVAFGGLFSPGTPQSTPHIEVLFDDVPGVLANCGPAAKLDPVGGPGGSFFPITTSGCIFHREMTQRPSFGEAFFLIAVHELGHALGLQHTLTSSAMATELTRATTRSAPLAADDIAGISVLYPAPGFSSQTGSISGQVVNQSGQSVHMASVVALAPDRPAVSALTHPDGTYRIDGLAPGQYYLYVHPLPPSLAPDLGPAEMVLPVDNLRQPIPQSDPFDTVFYPGTRDPQQAMQVQVVAGMTTSGLVFAVQRRSTQPQLYAVTTYSFPGQVAVKPAHLLAGAPQMLVAYASSPLRLTTIGALAPGLTVSVLGGGAVVQQMQPYPAAPHYLQVDLAIPQSAPGPRHLVFTLNNELYVLPSAFRVVTSPPPLIGAVLPGLDSSGKRWGMVTGTTLTPETRIVFDGLPAARIQYFSDAIVVTPPPGGPGYQATVTALNADGQSSLFLQAQAPATYTYEPGAPPAVFLSQNTLPAGAEAMIEITGVNTSFAEGQTVVGFGSSDIVVRRVWVLSPTRLRAQVAVSAAATPGATMVSMVSGFQMAWQPLAFQVSPANPRLPVINPQLLNPATGQTRVYPGGPAVALVSNLSQIAGIVTAVVYLNDQQLPVTSLAPGQVGFTIPAGFPAGPAVLRIQYGPEQIYPVIVSIDSLPPVVLAVSTGVVAVDAMHPTKPGDYLIVTVNGLAEAGAAVAPARVRVTVAGIEHQALGVAASATPMTSHQVLFALSPLISTGQHVLTVGIDGRASLPFLLYVRGS